MKRLYRFLPVFLLAVFCGMMTLSCSRVSRTDRMELKLLAQKIDALFVNARRDIEYLKPVAQRLLAGAEPLDGLYSDDRYQYTQNHVYYTPRDDGACEVWASGYFPIGGSERARIKRLEYLCPELKNRYDQSDYIDSVYLTTYDSIVIGYPYADMQAYMTSGLDLTKIWITYRAAAEQKNPARRTLWVEPYIDAIGRGYMTSVITPVYQDDFLEGTIGIDITADLISDKFISLSPKNLMIVTGTTIPVAMNKNSLKVLNIKGLEKYNYLQKESENKAISSSLMMAGSDSDEIRAIAAWISGPETEITLVVSGTTYGFIRESIPEVGWFLIEMKKNTWL